MAFITTPLKRVMSVLHSFTSNNANNMDENEVTLPRFTLHYLFQFLGRTDLVQCQYVSKLWHSVASDASFGWSLIDVMTLYPAIQPGAYYSSNRYSITDRTGPERIQGTSIPFYTVENASVKTIRTHINSDGVLTFYSRNHTPVAGPLSCYPTFEFSLKPTPKYMTVDSGDNILSVIQGIQANPRLWRCELIQYPKKANAVTHAIILEVNIPELERLTEAGKEVYWVERIVKTALKHNTKKVTSLMNKYSNEVHLPMKMVVPQKQPNGLTLSLYKYQLDAVNWMKSVEEDADIGFEYVTLIPWVERKSNALFDPYENVSVSVKDIPKHTKRTKPRGGILADEMGLGKTTEIISLILANPGDPSLIDPSNFSADKKAKITPTTSFAEKLFHTNATLVLCPSHLLKQWHEEIEKHTKLPLNIVYFSNIRDIRACTYSDIIGADIVLVAHQMLLNKNYFNMGCYGFASPTDSNAMTNRMKNINTIIDNIWGFAGGVLNAKGPVFEHFNWRRIVVDEAHEIIDHELYQKTFVHYTAQSWWYVTGTPFPTEESKVNLLRFLRFPESKDDLNITWTYTDIYVNNLFWRNTKESVKGEYEVPPLVEDLRLLNLTPIEKAIYSDFTVNYTDEIAEVCNSPGICKAFDKLLEERPTLADVRTAYIGRAKERIADAKSKIKQNEALLLDYAVELTELNEKVEERKVELAEQIEKEKEEKESRGSFVRFYKSKEMEKAESRVSTAKNQVLACEQKMINTRSRIADNKARIEYNNKLLAQLNDLEPASYKGPDMSSALTIPQPIPKKEEKSEAESISKTKEGEVKEEITWYMSAAQLKEELVKRGIKVNSKHKKADLQKEVKQATVNSNPSNTTAEDASEDEDAEDEKPTKRNGKAAQGKAKPKAKEEGLTKAEIDKMTVPQLTTALKKVNVTIPPKSLKKALQALLHDYYNKGDAEEQEEEGEEEEPKKTKGKRSRTAREASEGTAKKKPRVKAAAKKKKGEEEEEEEEAKPEVTSSNPNKKKTVQDKLNEQNLLKWLVEKEGTKLGNLMVYLKELWEENPSVKVIIFSQYPRLLDKISVLLEEREIDFSLVEGNATKRNKRLAAFKARDSAMHVLLLNITQAASGTNIVEASHIILMDPIITSEAQAVEAQAIARAHRQGQTEQVTVTRFIVRETKEYEAYVHHYGASSVPKDTPIDEHSASGRPKMQRTSSLVTALATTPTLLRTSSTLAELSENTLLQ